MIVLDPIIGTCIFIFGLIIGSFLNVCIVRLPHEKSVVRPRSQCVHCQHTIPWYDNVPLISFVILRGRCRFCHKAISFRYFLVELLTGIAFVVFYSRFGLTAVLLPYLIMLSGMIASTFIDFEHRIIPDEISIGGMIVGLIFSLFIPSMQLAQSQMGQGLYSHFLSLGYSLFGVLIGGGSIYALGVLGDIIFKKESMGGGDVKLMGMVGAFLGWKLALLTFFIAPFFGAIYGIVEKIRTKESAIAYGPFLVLGCLISLFWGDFIIEWIIRGYKIP